MRPASPSSPARNAQPEPKRLTVGLGISLSGEITICDQLIVQGDVQVTLNQTHAIEIAENGRFINGKAEVEEAVVGGLYEGELTVRGLLLIRSTGRVSGIIRYGELKIERGGKLAGSVSMLEDASMRLESLPAGAPLIDRLTAAVVVPTAA